MNPDELKLPPHSIEAEQAVLGGLMLKASAWDQIATIIDIDQFYRRDHRLIFKAMAILQERDEPVDALTVADLLERNKVQDQVGGSAYVTQLASNTPGAANIKAYAEIVRDRAQLRQLIDLGNKLASSAFGGEQATDLIDTATKNLMAMQISDQAHDVGIKDAVKGAYQEIEAAVDLEPGQYPGVPTGLEKLDIFLGGLHEQDLLVLGARPSVGKTAFMTQIAKNSATAGEPTGLITAEQGATQIAMRMIAQTGMVSLHDMRNGSIAEHQWPKISTGMKDVIDLPIMLWDRPAPDISEVMAQAREWKRKHDIKILMVDYLQLLTAKGIDKKNYEVGAIAKGLKQIARELNIAVVALAQLNRKVDDKGSSYIPVMSDLKDSGDIEQFADQIIFLVRPEVYKENAEPGIAKLAIRKNKHGPLGIIKFAWLGYCIRFEALAPEPYQQDIG